MKIYTKAGDKGKTSLIGGKQVSKAHLRIEAYGTIDELNSYIGLVRDQPVNQNRQEILKEIQDRLFTIGSSLAADPDNVAMRLPDLKEEDVLLLEREIDAMTEKMPPLRNFILPGGHSSISFTHLARCVCRRAERNVIALSESEFVAPLVIQYLNRLSDYLFTLCRMMHEELQIPEQPWKARIEKS
ncbi:MAG: cob(I)yrinic acid a,c-diamide adenosyltransferase [Microscillaceae bacterium]|nr:cob(I)yrinic acid a,c-diamide adenosyltransferase [Microscillaceae bacterium]MDW8461848.1 cob(I)yrinic acid a,c-diamide adenosyltransferase [Cytophagales bacterium]